MFLCPTGGLCGPHLSPPVPPGMNGARLLGMQHEAVLFLVEQLPGAGACGSYRFRYHPRGEPQRLAPWNPSGCARAGLYGRWEGGGGGWGGQWGSMGVWGVLWGSGW